MGTKLKPSSFDCYANAEPDEPMFILLARDHRSPDLVREWVARRGKNDDKAEEALGVADAMEAWRSIATSKPAPKAPR